ncbi:molybdopterin synthase sulfur carrier subunit [Methylomagnum ishizawai]|uniref:Molybdopterin synthase sulfur carrier subunit n=1 Tax=Methylomagnum ishizawai TaxID=1760988 RepID=A0A1Y6DC15_9GAMM|nr:MoaD/ThiS family protein [Methylomagnum ishizawai]SMF97145.1 molybdopterin synthase sulfur carrier subunit [Methylomagnum ishizawai]
MSITVRYFASLRETLGRAEETLAPDGLHSVIEVWQAVAAGRPLPQGLLCAINLEYADPATPVRDGDEVAFFPPVTGG